MNGKTQENVHDSAKHTLTVIMSCSLTSKITYRHGNQMLRKGSMNGKTQVVQCLHKPGSTITLTPRPSPTCIEQLIMLSSHMP